MLPSAMRRKSPLASGRNRSSRPPSSSGLAGAPSGHGSPSSRGRSRRSAAASSRGPSRPSRSMPAEARRVLREKIVEGLPAAPEDTFRSLAAVGLIDDPARMLDILVDFYASQVVAFYDPQPRRFYVVKGAEGLGEAGAEAGDLASGPHLFARADARPPGRDAPPGRAHPPAPRRRRPRLRAPVPPRGRSDARHGPRRARGDSRGGRERRGADGAAPVGRCPRARQRAQGRPRLLRRPALLSVHRRHGVRPRRGQDGAAGRRWTGSGRTRPCRAPRSSTDRRTRRRRRTSCPPTSSRSRRGSGSCTATRSASGRCGSCSGGALPADEAAHGRRGMARRPDRLLLAGPGRCRISGASASTSPASAARFEAALRKARAKRPFPPPRRSPSRERTSSCRAACPAAPATAQLRRPYPGSAAEGSS